MIVISEEDAEEREDDKDLLFGLGSLALIEEDEPH